MTWERVFRQTGTPSGHLLRRSYLVLALMGCLAATAEAQEARYALALRDVPLEEALEELVALTDVSLVYGDEVGEGRVFCRRTNATAEALLRCIVESAGLDYYRLSSGTYVVIEQAEQAPRYGSFAGVVVDGETGEPLPGASVLLADASAGTAANLAGMFAFSDLEPGPYLVTASFVGYEPAADSVWVPPDGRARHRIVLRPKPFAASPVVVDGVQQRAPTLAGQNDVSGAALRSATLGPANPVRAARALLGIGERPFRADLHIQGGQTGEHVTTLDGAPVFDPVALGRVLGAFSPLAVERLTVRKAGFGAAHGSYTAGVVEVEQALPRSGRAATAQVDPYSANVFVGAGGAKVAAMAAVRTSLWSLYRPGTLDGALRRWNDVDPLLTSALASDGAPADHLVYQPHRHGTDVAFTDLHAAARVALGPFRTLRVSGYRGANTVETELFAAGLEEGNAAPERLTLSRDRYRWTNMTGRVRVESLLGARTFGYAGIRASHHTLAHGYQRLDAADIGYTPTGGDVPTFEARLREALDAEPFPDDGNRVTEWVAEAGLDVSLSPSHLVEIGVEGAVVDHAFHLDNPYLRPIRSASTLGRLAASITDRFQLSRRTTIEGGLRMTWVPDRAAVYAEPRLAVRYDADRSPVGPYAVRVAAGLYRQFVNQFDVTNVGPSAIVPSVRFWLPVDVSLAPPRALHVAAEGFVTPARGWTVRGETYYKQLPHLLALDYASLLDHSAAVEADAEQASFIGAARGFAYGGGLRIEWETDRMRVHAGYDYSVSERTFPSRFDGGTQPAPWSQPHRLQLGADFDLGAGFLARLRGRGLWGRTWGFRQAYYDFLLVHGGATSVGLPEDDTLPALVELDLGLGYNRRVAGTNVALSLDVLNVLDRGNVLDYSLRRVGMDHEAVPRYGLGLQPVLTLRVGR